MDYFAHRAGADRLSLVELEAVRVDAFADDVGIQSQRMRWWPEVAAKKFFESGGKILPRSWEEEPLEFTRPGEDTRAKIATITPVVETEDTIVCDAPLYELRQGFVRVRTFAPSHVWASDLGECGDASCQLSRLRWPSRRECFRTRVVAATVEALRGSGEPVHYLTVGSGLLLSDFEILLALSHAGLTIASIVAVDLTYRGLRHRETADARKALEQLARFATPASVLAFSSLDSLIDACEREGSVLGNATTFVQCDASSIPRQASREAASVALSPAGLAFILDNDEALTYEVWQRRSRPLPAPTGASATPEDPNPLDEVSMWVASRMETLEAGRLVRSIERGAEGQTVEPPSSAPLRPSRLRYKVVFHGRVAVRAAPSPTASVVGSRSPGDEVVAEEERRGWVRLASETHSVLRDRSCAACVLSRGLLDECQQAAVGGNSSSGDQERLHAIEEWMLLDGTALGLGELLRRLD